jgi:hypothetical protein
MRVNRPFDLGFAVGSSMPVHALWGKAVDQQAVVRMGAAGFEPATSRV